MSNSFLLLFLLLATLLAVAGITSGQQIGQPCSYLGEPYYRFKEDFLEKSSYYRRLHQAPELLNSYQEMEDWAQQLADYWLTWADTGYDPRSDNSAGYGMIALRVPPSDAQRGDALVQQEYERGEAVYRENGYYNQEPDTYLHPEVLNFAQLVWKNSSYIGLGCAVAEESKELFAIAAYHPAGNVNGEYAENVLPPEEDKKEKDKKKKKKEEKEELKMSPKRGGGHQAKKGITPTVA